MVIIRYALLLLCLDLNSKEKAPQALRWRHNERDCVSNHQPYGCLLNRLFRRRSKKTSKLRLTGLCAGNSPGTGEFPAQMASNAENVSIWWRHHGCIGPNCMVKSGPIITQPISHKIFKIKTPNSSSVKVICRVLMCVNLTSWMECYCGIKSDFLSKEYRETYSAYHCFMT